MPRSCARRRTSSSPGSSARAARSSTGPSSPCSTTAGDASRAPRADAQVRRRARLAVRPGAECPPAAVSRPDAALAVLACAAPFVAAPVLAVLAAYALVVAVERCGSRPEALISRSRCSCSRTPATRSGSRPAPPSSSGRVRGARPQRTPCRPTRRRERPFRRPRTRPCRDDAAPARAAARARREVAVVCDPDPAAGADLREPRTRDWREAIALDVDAVLVATPPDTHTELAAAALEAGRHVYLEKPAATSVPEAARLAALARERDRRLQLGYAYRHHPLWQQARRLALEQPLRARGRFASSRHGGAGGRCRRSTWRPPRRPALGAARHGAGRGRGPDARSPARALAGREQARRRLRPGAAGGPRRAPPTSPSTGCAACACVASRRPASC